MNDEDGAAEWTLLLNSYLAKSKHKDEYGQWSIDIEGVWDSSDDVDDHFDGEEDLFKI